MSIETIKANLQEITKMMNENKAMEVFEKFYADDVIMSGTFEPLCIGKKENEKREIEFFASLVEFREAKLISVYVAPSDDEKYEFISVDLWHNDYTMKAMDGGENRDVNQNQMGITYWKNGMIAKQHFFYPTEIVS